MKNINDLTGQKFGRLKVLELDKDKNGNPKRPGAYWFCKCNCGNIKSVRGNSLVIGSTQSCGCLAKELKNSKRDMNSMLGKRFGRLIVTERDLNYPSGNHVPSYWKCLCDCGNFITTARVNLVTGDTKSCGCYKIDRIKETHIKDISNNKYGRLTAIRRTEDKRYGCYIWECQCECGNICYYDINTLNANKAISCGCERSLGERIINEILLENNYSFTREYSFLDMTDRRYDFAILEDEKIVSLIEFDGEQHQEGKSSWYSKEIEERDIQKNLYALEHNIPLYRIPYQYRDKITLELLFNSKFLVTKENI